MCQVNESTLNVSTPFNGVKPQGVDALTPYKVYKIISILMNGLKHGNNENGRNKKVFYEI